MRYLEAVTVSVGFSDFLAQAIPYNLPLVDRWIVVTEPQDEDTRELCRRHGLECIQSEDGRDNGDFAKGRLVERGLQHLSAVGHRLHLDSDMVLPLHTRQLLDIADLQDDTIYGCDRILCRSWEDWQKIRNSKYLEGDQYHAGHCITFPEGFSLGSRWASLETGFVPIGAFQLWHSSQDEWRGRRIKSYPVRHGNACRTDIQHGLQFDRKKRELIPELIAVHLESEPAPNGVNWNGRKTKYFGPSRPGDKPIIHKPVAHDRLS